MIAKITKGANFAGVLRYILNPEKQTELIDASGVRLKDMDTIIQSFERQKELNPRISKPVGHISLDFSAQDSDKLTNETMVRIARDYMKRMGITNTQYMIVRHNDREHPHVHIVYNRIDNNGNTISDKNDRYRNEQACKKLKQKHGLYFASSKEKVKQDRLKEPDKTKYEIYTAINNGLQHAKDWQQLKNHLSKDGIEIRFKYKGQTDVIQGISFAKGEYSFKGSEIDRNFSYSKLDALLNQNSQSNHQEIQSIKPETTKPNMTDAISGIGDVFNFPNSAPPMNETDPYKPKRPKKKKNKRGLKL